MIPLRLSVRNFLCYGEGLEPLDMEGIHVACLCGDNGHGKSALLDAMTWALWGQARASRQEDLIHQGKDEMQVDLEFLAGGQRYRVIRKHARRGRGRQGATDLQLLVSTGDGFRTITENSVRQTEERVRRLLRMDYTTFINTAFLLQGQADRFTASPPTERKRLLAEVLDLEAFERAAQQAKERARTIEQQQREVQGALGALAQQLDSLPDYQRRLEQAQGELVELHPLLEARTQRVRSLEESVERLRLQQRELDRVREEMERARQEQQQLAEQVSTQEARVKRLEGLVERRGEVEDGYRRWRQAQDEEEALERTREQVEALARQQNALERTVEQVRQRLQSEADYTRTRLEGELEPRAGRVAALERDLEVARGQAQALEQEHSLLQQRRGELEAMGARAQEVATLQRLAQEEMEQLRARFSLLSQADAQCPLCGTPLGPENRRHLEAEIQEQEALAQQRRMGFQQELRALERGRQELQREVERREQELGRSQRQHQASLTGLERGLAEARGAAGEAALLRQQLGSLEERLAGEAYASPEQEQLRLVNQRVEALAYDPARHREVRGHVRALEEHQGLRAQLQEALQGLEEERRALASTRQMAEARAGDIARAQERLESLLDATGDLPRQEQALGEAREAWEALEQRRQAVEETAKRCQWEVERLEGLAQHKAERERELATLQRRQSTYEELAGAFGKNGVQAYLIDEALPELEQEANALLSQLTDNRMHLKLETQRERRTTQGDPIETLDIHIADELGTRSYDLFSGGEAFRVNFALRVALSKLLAHRAGAPLPTLFIDEGFGTQDAAGRQRLVEAISSIQGDFERIIVITHIEEMKDLFPVRIEVEKSAAGSTFWVS